MTEKMVYRDKGGQTYVVYPPQAWKILLFLGAALLVAIVLIGTAALLLYMKLDDMNILGGLLMRLDKIIYIMECGL